MTRRDKMLALFTGIALIPAISIFAQDSPQAKTVVANVEKVAPVTEAQAVEKIKEEGLKK